MVIKILALQAKTLNNILKSIPKIKSSVPERPFFVFSASDDKDCVTIAVNQGYFSLIFDVSCIVKEGGTCTIPQDVLLRVFSTMHDDILIEAISETVKLSSSEGYMVELPKLPVPELPQPDCQKLICSFQKNQMDFLQALNRCKLQASKSEISFGQSGFLQGADGYHILQYGSREADDEVFTILPMVLPMFRTLFPEGCETWKGEWSLAFKNRVACLSVHLLPTTVPVVFSLPETDRVTMNAAELKQALSRISTVSLHKGKITTATIVKMETVDGKLVLTVDSDNYFGSINTVYTQSIGIPCTGNLPEPLYINYDYLTDLISATTNSEIQLIPEGTNIANFVSGAVFSRVGLMQKPRKEKVA